MIEVIYKEEKQEGADTVSVPRNIRQIGFINGDCRIYIEDYVYTFLGRTASSEKVLGSKTGCAAVLTGEIKWQEGIAYVFVKGAVLAEKMEATREHIDFSEEIWADIHSEQEKYFPEQEIVGWFFTQPESPVMETEVFTRAHVKNFGGEKVLMLLDPVEREDGFFRYENGKLIRQRGYYIYYEKNSQMQAYMIDKNPDGQTEKMEETGDEAVKNIRKLIRAKKNEEPEEKTEEKSSVFSYAVTAALAVAVLAVGVNFYQDYRTAGRNTGQAGQVREVSSVAVTEKPQRKAQKTEKKIKQRTEEKTEEKRESAVLIKPAEKLEPTQTPKPTEIPFPERNEVDSSSIYKEESDVRKAKRRERLEKETSSGNVGESYVIRPGDTLYQISIARYGSTDAVKEICRLNGLSEQEIIYPGQIIVLP